MTLAGMVAKLVGPKVHRPSSTSVYLSVVKAGSMLFQDGAEVFSNLAKEKATKVAHEQLLVAILNCSIFSCTFSFARLLKTSVKYVTHFLPSRKCELDKVVMTCHVTCT